MKRVFIVCLLAALAAFSLAASGAQESSREKIVFNLSDNLPDETSPVRIVSDLINEEFLEMHPEIEIQTESYPDQPYQEKMRIYATSNQLPEVMKWWGLPSLYMPFVENGYLAELPYDHFKGLGFIPGSLESNMVAGKLYGVPNTTDFWILYYNEGLLEKVGVEVPETWEDIISAVPKFNNANVIPVVTDGKDRWPLSIIFETLAMLISGDAKINQKAIEGEVSYNNPAFLQAAQIIYDFKLQGVFQQDLVTSDYGAARNLFGQGLAAMYVMGSWELGLSNDESFSEEFRSNVRATHFPTVVGGKGDVGDLYAWFGGNYVVNADAVNMDLSMEYIKYFFSRYPELTWKNNAGFPAQVVKETGDENQLTRDLLAILNGAESTSGILAYAALSPAFDQVHEDLCKSLAANIETPESFITKLQAAVEKELR